MGVFWSAFFCMIAETLPFRLLAYYPFRHRLRLPVPAVAALVGGSQLVLAALYGFAALNGWSSAVPTLVFAAACLCTFLSCIRADMWKALFLCIFVTDYVIVVRGLAYFIEASLFYRPDMVLSGPRTSLIIVILFAVSSPLILWFFHRTRDRVLQTDAPAMWRTIWIMPAFTTLIVLMYTTDVTPESVRRPEFLIARVLLIELMFVVYDVLLYTLDVLRRQAALSERSAQQKMMLAMQSTQYHQLERHIQDATQARHDLRQHLRIIRSYLEDGSIDELREYLDRYEQYVPPDTNRTFCRNYAVNTIVCYYAEEARKAQVDFSVRVNIPEKLAVGEPELCAILGNLLENALDACRGITECAPFIRLRADGTDGRIALVVDNTCLSAPAQRGGRFLSSKHGGYGTGTASVRAIAERYNGTAEFRCENNVFYASVLLQQPDDGA